MAESETSALGGARDESTDELHGREEPTPCVEDDAEDGAERVESREMKQARKGPTPGIVYLSRIPPFMKPLKVRHLLSQHGEVGHVFLQPEGVCTSTHEHAVRVLPSTFMYQLEWQDHVCQSAASVLSKKQK